MLKIQHFIKNTVNRQKYVYNKNVKGVEIQMKKIILLLLSLTLLLFNIVSCGKKEDDAVQKQAIENTNKIISMVVPDGLPSIASAQLIKDNIKIKGYSMKYYIESSPENIVSEVLKGDVDIAIVPSNISATQYNKDAGYVIASTIGWGSFYLISTDEKTDINDLKDKEIYNIGKGLTPDIIFKSILKDKGFNLDNDFDFSYVNSVSEEAPLLIAGKANYAVITEPALSQVSNKINNVNVVMDLNEEWKKVNDSEYGYPQSTLIIKKDLAKNDKAFVSKFLQGLKDSCKFANENPEETANFCEEIGVSTDKNIIPKAIEKANINYVSINDCYKNYETYFQKLYDFDSATIGGKIPDEAIFMGK